MLFDWRRRLIVRINLILGNLKFVLSIIKLIQTELNIGSLVR